MPKIVRSAATALGEGQPVEETRKSPFAGGSLLQKDGIPEQEIKIADPVTAGPATPQPGFAPPPPAPEPEPSVAPKVETTPVVDAPTDPVEPVPAQVKEWRFVKNIHTHEKIVLEGGLEFRFERSLFITQNAALAAKILAVASRYSIVEQ